MFIGKVGSRIDCLPSPLMKVVWQSLSVMFLCCILQLLVWPQGLSNACVSSCVFLTTILWPLIGLFRAQIGQLRCVVVFCWRRSRGETKPRIWGSLVCRAHSMHWCMRMCTNHLLRFLSSSASVCVVRNTCHSFSLSRTTRGQCTLSSDCLAKDYTTLSRCTAFVIYIFNFTPLSWSSTCCDRSSLSRRYVFESFQSFCIGSSCVPWVGVRVVCYTGTPHYILFLTSV